MQNKQRPYQKYAEIYDQLSGKTFSAAITEYAFQILHKYRYQPGSALDLCCGTGTAAIMFARNGYETVGLDRSAEMLKIARKKSAEEKINAKFVRQSLPDFKLISGRTSKLKNFDLITCFYDSLNYLQKENEIKKTFANVYRHLNPNGLFIFDMNTFNSFEKVWSKTHAGEKNGLVWIFRTEVNNKKKTARLIMDIFMKEQGQWRRYQEEHVERAYSDLFIKQALHRAGFKSIRFYHCFTFRRPSGKTGRIAVVARK